FEKFIFTPHVQLIDLTIEGETYRTMIQDVQYHPVSDKTLHADFLQVIEGKPVKISVPITITGTSPGVLKGGKLTMKMRRLHIMALENNLPDTLEVDISNLEIAQSIRVENLVREDIIFLDAPRAVVVTVKAGRGAVVAAEEETEGEHTEAAPQE
ncbi:MAG: 50S ribosomal protein L25, partial [Bacteroidia bacterium]|nr:50S ribosomal protein L25 [Bacteroidia bacterium]